MTDHTPPGKDATHEDCCGSPNDALFDDAPFFDTYTVPEIAVPYHRTRTDDTSAAKHGPRDLSVLLNERVLADEGVWSYFT